MKTQGSKKIQLLYTTRNKWLWGLEHEFNEI